MENKTQPEDLKMFKLKLKQIRKYQTELKVGI